MTTEEELSLAAQAKAGDKEALGLLWDAITPKLYGYLINTVRDKTLADDLLQQTWLKALEHIHRFQTRGVRFSAWLFAIARNECRQHWRSRASEPLDSIGNDEIPARPERHEEKLLIEHVLKKLPEKDEEILQLRYIAGLSFREIARVLNISAISARVRVHRAIARARKFI